MRLLQFWCCAVVKAMHKSNLIIAGVNKAGTTSLFSYLAKHPNICGSTVKETCFFLPIRYGESLPAIDNYQQYFDGCSNERWYLESTPGYFYGGKPLVQEIVTKLDRPKIIIVLRDPLKRLLSFYKFQINMLKLEKGLSFSSYIECCLNLNDDDYSKRENNPFFGVEGGMYYKYINDWIDGFGDDLMVVWFEQLQNSPQELMKTISNWIGVDCDYYDEEKFTVENKTVAYKNAYLQSMALKVNQYGARYFREYPSIKRFLRSCYYRLNGDKAGNNINIDIAEFESIYADANVLLRSQLQGVNGISNAPNWLV